MSSNTLVYKVRSLTKVYKKGRILANDGINLMIKQGEILGVFGPNGAGKTTLIKQMVGLLKPTSGSIHLFGRDLVAHPNLAPNLVAYFSQRIASLGSFKFIEVLQHAGVLRV